MVTSSRPPPTRHARNRPRAQRRRHRPPPAHIHRATLTPTAASRSTPSATSNLSFEGCAKNTITGNPGVQVAGNVVGHTTYTRPWPITPTPRQVPAHPLQHGDHRVDVGRLQVRHRRPHGLARVKYVVAHLVDRDGFCDAASFNNVLGVSVRFEIDAGGGTIIEAADRPVTSQEQALRHRHDVRYAGRQGNRSTPPSRRRPCRRRVPGVDQGVQQPPRADQRDRHASPRQPAPVPGDIRLTGALLRREAETVTVTNKGATPVNLAGFALRSLPNAIAGQEEHLGLIGSSPPGRARHSMAARARFDRLAPDRARRVPAQPATTSGSSGTASKSPARPATGVTLQRVAAEPAARGWRGRNRGRHRHPLRPGEAGRRSTRAGTSSARPRTRRTSPRPSAATKATSCAIYGWNAATGLWLALPSPGAPLPQHDGPSLQAGQAYWVQVKRPFTLTS